MDREVEWSMLREWNMEVEKRMQSNGQHTRAKQRMTQETQKQERALQKNESLVGSNSKPNIYNILEIMIIIFQRKIKKK